MGAYLSKLKTRCKYHRNVKYMYAIQMINFTLMHALYLYNFPLKTFDYFRNIEIDLIDTFHVANVLFHTLLILGLRT